MAVTPLGKSPSRGRNTAIALGVAVTLTTVISGLLFARAGFGKAADPRAPMPVETTTYAIEAGYARELPFLGLVRAGQSSNIGFEVPGQLSRLLVTEGTVLSGGDTIGMLDTSQLESQRAVAEANLRRVEAELELARLKAQRQKDLSASGAVSKEAYDETRLSAQALAAQLGAVSAQLRSIDIDLEKSELKAPYDGVVAARFVNEGAVISMGTPVIRLVASAGREAHIGVAVEYAHLLRQDDVYSLKLRDQSVPARLRSVRPDVDPATLTMTAVFELPAGTGVLDGEPVSLLLSENVAVEGGWLPLSALIEGERGLWNVYRLAPQDNVTVTAREVVEVLEVQGNRVFVRGTLADGERVVTDGLHRVTAGTAVDPGDR